MEETMKTKYALFVLSVLIGGLILSACGPAAAPGLDESYEFEAAATSAAVMDEPLAPQLAPAGEADAAAREQAGVAGPVYNTGGSPEDSAYAASHMIIKNADIKLSVEDTDVAIDRTTQIVGDLGGYIISSRVWYQDWYDGENYKYATITVGIPVEQFERMLSRLRGLSVKVLDESATGEDVTDQYVDLQSQLTNLEATRDRIKSFLDQAQSVDEALRINQELSNVEAQIESIKGRMNYLQDRASYSTITVNYEPVLPDLLPDPTPTPSPWDPGQTFQNATKTLTGAYQGIGDFLIWFLVVPVPILGPIVLLVWLVLKFLLRKPAKPAS
jgi:hypothetical protein